MSRPHGCCDRETNFCCNCDIGKRGGVPTSYSEEFTNYSYGLTFICEIFHFIDFILSYKEENTTKENKTKGMSEIKLDLVRKQQWG